MSRLSPQTLLSDAESVTASALDSGFDALETASASINQHNTRDGAVDLPQMAAGHVVRFSEDITLGPDDWDLLTNIQTVVAQTALPLSPEKVWVDDPTAANQSFVYFGLGGLTFAAGDVIRVSWSLNVEPLFVNTPYATAGARGLIELENSGGGTLEVSDGLHAWPFYLEWDITDNTLTNWEPVLNQTAFDETVGPTSPARIGGKIEDCLGASFCPAWTAKADGVDDQEVSGGSVFGRGWRTIRGTWLHQMLLGGDTIFGLRLVFKPTLYHPAYSVADGNCMVTDLVAAVDNQISWQGGRLTCIVMRGS